MIGSLSIAFTLYVMVKSFIELYYNGKHSSEGNPVYGSVVHSNQHMVLLLFIIVYLITNIFASIYFHFMADMSRGIEFYLLSKFTFLNLGLLLVINHFKQERKDSVKVIPLSDIFK